MGATEYIWINKMCDDRDPYIVAAAWSLTGAAPWSSSEGSAFTGCAGGGGSNQAGGGRRGAACGLADPRAFPFRR